MAHCSLSLQILTLRPQNCPGCTGLEQLEVAFQKEDLALGEYELDCSMLLRLSAGCDVESTS